MLWQYFFFFPFFFFFFGLEQSMAFKCEEVHIHMTPRLNVSPSHSCDIFPSTVLLTCRAG